MKTACSDCTTAAFQLGRLFQRFQGDYEKPGPWADLRKLLDFNHGVGVDLCHVAVYQAFWSILELVEQKRLEVKPAP